VFYIVGLCNQLTYYFVQFNNDTLLAGVGEGQALIMVSYISIVVGLNGALETFISRNYAAGNLVACGQYLNLAKLVNLILAIPFFFVCLFAE
jgi:Na+-driven multidrug efflux pump